MTKLTEDQVWQRIRTIYAQRPEFIDYPLPEWSSECGGCIEDEIARMHDGDWTAVDDWLRLEDAFYLIGIDARRIT